MCARIAGVVALALLVSFVGQAHGQSPVITYPAGNYTVSFAVPTPFVGPFTITQTANGFTLTWGSVPTPVPPPVPVPPPPAPTPLPVVPSGIHCWAVALIDPAQTLPPGQVAALTSSTLQRSAELLDIGFQAHSKAESAANVQSYLAHVTSYPALVIVTPGVKPGSGDIAPGAVVPLPASEADILVVLNKVRGK